MKYFAYGSNMDLDRINERLKIVLKGEKAVLEGWRLEFNKIAKRNPKEGYANIIKDPDENIEGVLYDLSEDNIKVLDGWEGYPLHYNKIDIKVKVEKGIVVPAIAYVAQPEKTKQGLLPSKEYLNHLLKGKSILSLEYYNKLENRETLD